MKEMPDWIICGKQEVNTLEVNKLQPVTWKHANSKTSYLWQIVEVRIVEGGNPIFLIWFSKRIEHNVTVLGDCDDPSNRMVTKLVASTDKKKYLDKQHPSIMVSECRTNQIQVLLHCRVHLGCSWFHGHQDHQILVCVE